MSQLKHLVGKLGGEMTRSLTELSGSFTQDKRLIKLMVAHLAKHAEDSARGRGENRLREIILTMGDDGVLLCNVGSDITDGQAAYVHIPAEAVPVANIKSVIGAGDCLIAGVIAGLT